MRPLGVPFTVKSARPTRWTRPLPKPKASWPASRHKPTRVRSRTRVDFPGACHGRSYRNPTRARGRQAPVASRVDPPQHAQAVVRLPLLAPVFPAVRGLYARIGRLRVLSQLSRVECARAAEA